MMMTTMRSMMMMAMLCRNNVDVLLNKGIEQSIDLFMQKRATCDSLHPRNEALTAEIHLPAGRERQKIMAASRQKRHQKQRPRC